MRMNLICCECDGVGGRWPVQSCVQPWQVSDVSLRMPIIMNYECTLEIFLSHNSIQLYIPNSSSLQAGQDSAVLTIVHAGDFPVVSRATLLASL